MRINFANSLQIRTAIYAAREEVLITLPDCDASVEPSVDIAAACIMAAADVPVRLYVPAALRGTQRIFEAEVVRLARAGLEIRTTAEPLPRMALVDGSVIVLACNGSDYSDGALVGLDLPFTPMIIHSLTKVGEEGAAATEMSGERRLVPLDREVLRQLALGSKDEAAAREMGMALRTYRRVVARLMCQLDARSRFQAGFLAAQRRWL